MQDKRVLTGEVVSPRDSFDLGEQRGLTQSDTVARILSNPQSLMNSLNLTAKQAENIASIIAGGSAGLGYKYLSRYIGGELASAVGGFLGAHVARKLTGK